MSEATPQYGAPNPAFERTVEERILGMPAAGFFGFRFGAVEPGFAEIVQPYREELSHREGFFQGGVIGALADFAAGASAGSLLPPGWENATADYTVKIVAPDMGEELVARGRVVKPGRTLTAVSVEVHAAGAGRAELRSILDSLGQPGGQLVEQTQAPESKLRLRDQSQRARNLGIFGAPNFVVGEELFWGNDRLEDALAWASYQTDEDAR